MQAAPAPRRKHTVMAADNTTTGSTDTFICNRHLNSSQFSRDILPYWAQFIVTLKKSGSCLFLNQKK
jgi:hypothetical protein